MTDIASNDLRARRQAKNARGQGVRQPAHGRKVSARTLSRRAANYLKRPLRSLGVLIFSAGVIAVIVAGWQNRHEEYLTAEEGLGYQLGIAGAVMMLVLLFYPLRKNLKMFRGVGGVAFWFKLHMLLGILGPVLILFHSNFRLGSTNSSIALISTLVVAVSGLIGRYIYVRIHMGLYGKKARIGEILADADAFKRAMGADVNDFARIEQDLKDFEKRVLVSYQGLVASVWSSLTLPIRIHYCHTSILHRSRMIVRSQAKRKEWKRKEQRARLKAAEQHLSEYFGAVRKASQFALFERLFSLWHVLHLPLFFFLIFSTVVHIVAVHMF